MSETLNTEKETVDAAAEQDQSNQPSQDGEGSQQDVVSRAEYEALQKQLKQAEFVIEKSKKQAKVAPAPKPIATASEGTEEVISRLREEFAADYLEETLVTLSTDTVERERILDEYNNSIVKSGLSKSSIKNDLLKAAKLVRSDFNEKVARESALSQQTKQTIANNGGSTNQDRPQPQEDWKRYLKASDLKYMTERKWSEEKMRQAAMNIKAQSGR
jgi:hypothetical protein